MVQRRLCVHGEKCRPLSFKQLLNCRVLHDSAHTIESIAEHCAIKLSRLRKYISESETDQIPFLALLRVAAFLDAWDLVDYALQAHGRRTAPIDAAAAPANPLNEAVDVAVAAATLLEAVRAAAVDGIDDSEKARVRELLRVVHREVDDVSAALDQAGAK